jgi:hypothetical protein
VQIAGFVDLPGLTPPDPGGEWVIPRTVARQFDRYAEAGDCSDDRCAGTKPLLLARN